ncbi:MAG TPA: CoA transferase [Candidatus Hydrogenedentes bacterium]|nr:CoA transferase [Candidatus Hydrogenedentota bacterium]
MASAWLRGIRVVGLVVNIPGPYAVARMRAMGAETIKVEPPEGDPLAAVCPAYHDALNAGAKVIRLDLKTTQGMTAFHDLLQDADLLITTQRPAALERLRLSWDALHSRHPRLCHVAIVGYPPPRAEVAGHDLTYQAHMGLIDGDRMPRTLSADILGAEHAVSAAAALLFARERRAQAGQCLVSLAEAAHHLAKPFQCGLTAPGGPLGGGLPIYRIYPAKEGRVAVASLEPHFTEKLRQALGLSRLSGETIGAALRTRTAAEWEAWAKTLDLPLAAVREWPQ